MTVVTMSRWVGKFPSLKLGRMVGYQSLIERDFIYLTGTNGGAANIFSQMLTRL